VINKLLLHLVGSSILSYMRFDSSSLRV